ncbi:lipocalin family protein [Streptomyces sp. NPDC052610]|uniref:lipocalin family protein n=1 Tax=Streptomyces sp. NPDC052610 TaxID=3154952 RepID=UPI0034200E0D
MSLDVLRAMSRMVGRRTALRYLAVGVGASLLAACKGDGDKKSGGGTKNDGGTTGGDGQDGGGGQGGGGTGSGSGGTKGVAGNTLAAFVRGTWKITTETTDGETFSYSATVRDGAWTLDFGGGKAEQGTWALQGGRLVLGVSDDFGSGEGAGEPGEPTDEAAAENVPATVGDSVSLFLPWQPPGMPGTGDGQQLDVNYTKQSGVLRIRHIEPSGMTVHTCTRV